MRVILIITLGITHLFHNLLSQNANSCPVDRIEFYGIRVYKHYGGCFVHELTVEGKAFQRESADADVFCEVCGSGSNEQSLLLCDGCDLG